MVSSIKEGHPFPTTYSVLVKFDLEKLGRNGVLT